MIPTELPLRGHPRPSIGVTIIDDWHPEVMVVYGAIPLNILEGLSTCFPERAVMSTTLPRVLGADHVFCDSPEVARELEAHYCPRPEPGAGISAWWYGPDVGLSSAYMAWVLAKSTDPKHQRAYTVNQSNPEPHHPHDADDFGRCLALLTACPELRGSLDKMRESSPQWDRLVSAWDAIEAEFPGDECTRMIQEATR